MVALEVAKQGAIYHGLATLLSQPSPVMSRGNLHNPRYRTLSQSGTHPGRGGLTLHLFLLNTALFQYVNVLVNMLVSNICLKLFTYRTLGLFFICFESTHIFYRLRINKKLDPQNTFLQIVNK